MVEQVRPQPKGKGGWGGGREDGSGSGAREGMRGGAPEPSSGLRTFLGPTGRSAYMRRVLTDFRAYRPVGLHEACAHGF